MREPMEPGHLARGGALVSKIYRYTCALPSCGVPRTSTTKTAKYCCPAHRMQHLKEKRAK